MEERKKKRQTRAREKSLRLHYSTLTDARSGRLDRPEAVAGSSVHAEQQQQQRDHRVVGHLEEGSCWVPDKDIRQVTTCGPHRARGHAEVAGDAVVAVVVAGQGDDHMKGSIELETMKAPAGVVAGARWGSRGISAKGEAAAGVAGTGVAERW